ECRRMQRDRTGVAYRDDADRITKGFEEIDHPHQVINALAEKRSIQMDAQEALFKIAAERAGFLVRGSCGRGFAPAAQIECRHTVACLDESRDGLDRGI